MTEAELALAAETQASTEAQANASGSRWANFVGTISGYKKELAAFTAGTLLLAACTGDNAKKETQAISKTNAAAEVADGVCDTPNVDAYLANTLHADTRALTPALGEKQSNSEVKLYSKDKAQKILEKQVSNDARVAAVYSELYKFRDGHKDIKTLTPAGIHETSQAFDGDSKLAADQVAYICGQLEYIKTTDNFAVTGGDATEITFENPTGKEVTAIRFDVITVDRVVSGFTLGANLDDAKLTADQKAFLKQFQNDVIQTWDGKIIIRHMALSGTAEVDGAAEGGSAESDTEGETAKGKAKTGGGKAKNNEGDDGEGDENGEGDQLGGPSHGLPGPGPGVSQPGAGPDTGGGNAGGGNGGGGNTTTTNTTQPKPPKSTTTTNTTQPPPPPPPPKSTTTTEKKGSTPTTTADECTPYNPCP